MMISLALPYRVNSRKLFSESPQDVIQIISDFLGKKETLNKLFPLSRELFFTILNENFKMTFVGRDGESINISYHEFLKDKLQNFKETISKNGEIYCFSESHCMHRMISLLSNMPRAVQHNLIQDPSVISISMMFSFPVFIFYLVYDVILNVPIVQSVLGDVIKEYGLMMASVLVVIFLYHENQSHHLSISAAQEKVIMNRIECARAKRQSPFLEDHIWEITEILKKIELEKKVSA